MSRGPPWAMRPGWENPRIRLSDPRVFGHRELRARAVVPSDCTLRAAFFGLLTDRVVCEHQPIHWLSGSCVAA